MSTPSLAEWCLAIESSTLGLPDWCESDYWGGDVVARFVGDHVLAEKNTLEVVLSMPHRRSESETHTEEGIVAWLMGVPDEDYEVHRKTYTPATLRERLDGLTSHILSTT